MLGTEGVVSKAVRPVVRRAVLRATHGYPSVRKTFIVDTQGAMLKDAQGNYVVNTKDN